jgi:hypothetical protein
MRLHVRNVPARLATGAYILHAGLEKWKDTRSGLRACTGWPPARTRPWAGSRR